MLYWDLQKCLWDDFSGMAVLEAVQGRYAVIRRFFFLSSIWTLLTVIWQQGTSPSSCLLFIGVHRGVMRREAAGRASATWRILPSSFPQVFCTAFLHLYNFLPHTDITGEEKVMKSTSLCELVLLNPQTAHSEIIITLFTPFVFSCSSFITKKVFVPSDIT